MSPCGGTCDARLRGQFQHSLDAKGRLILPARSDRSSSAAVTSARTPKAASRCGRPGSSRVRPTSASTQSRTGGHEGRQRARYWAANSSDVEFDKQGRFALPPAIRDYGQLEGDVLVVGVLDHVELWNPRVYAEQVNSAEEIFKQGSD